MKRATSSSLVSTDTTSDFNSRSHEESDMPSQVQRILLLISIHALMKRATVMTTPFELKTFISIHALMKRATSVVL